MGRRRSKRGQVEPHQPAQQKVRGSRARGRRTPRVAPAGNHARRRQAPGSAAQRLGRLRHSRSVAAVSGLRSAHQRGGSRGSAPQATRPANVPSGDWKLRPHRRVGAHRRRGRPAAHFIPHRVGVARRAHALHGAGRRRQGGRVLREARRGQAVAALRREPGGAARRVGVQDGDGVRGVVAEERQGHQHRRFGLGRRRRERERVLPGVDARGGSG